MASSHRSGGASDATDASGTSRERTRQESSSSQKSNPSEASSTSRRGEADIRQEKPRRDEAAPRSTDSQDYSRGAPLREAGENGAPGLEDTGDLFMKTPAGKMTAREAIAWQQSRVRDLWRIFQIMSEFVDGFETLSELGPCVSVFGSARVEPGDPRYELGQKVARELAKKDFGVITGGGPGMMEAANQGAQEAGGVSVGLNIDIPHEQAGNPYVDDDKMIDFDFFFVRKVMFVKYAQGFIVLPGGYGTLDELFEALTLIQTGKSTRFPVVLIGREFWGGLVSWLEETVLQTGNVSPDDTDLFHITDDPVEAVEIIDAFYREHAMTPNF